MGNSSSNSRHEERHQHQHHAQPPPAYQYPPPPSGPAPGPPTQQQPYNPYAQTRVYPPPPSGYSGYTGYSGGQYYGQYGGTYSPYQQQQQQPNYQQPYMPGQYGQPPPPGSAGARQAPAPGPPPPTNEVQATQTIRNQVNLKKTSIKVQPLPGSSSQFSISFSFDATAACRVSVFVNCRDESMPNKIVLHQSPLIVGKCDKGIDRKFPEAGAPPVLVDASALKDWLKMPEDRYAVVVHLEALTDEGRAQNKSLDSVQVGAEAPQWVQSQTTFAKMQRHEDGTWVPSTVLQKICFKGKVFELQEIYGMEQGRPAETVDGFDEVEGNECVICMSEPRDTTALPCRHMCMCHTCANELKAQTNKCPICRNVISSLLHIKIANNHGGAGAPGGAAGAAGAAGTSSTAPGTGK